MLALGFKMFLRKGEMSLPILAVAFLVAILASTNSVANCIDSQAQMLGRLVSPGRTYIILSRNLTSIMDSQVSVELAYTLSNLSCVEHVFPQRVLTANLTMNSIGHTIQVRGVGDIDGFLRARGAYVNGTVAKNQDEANAGEVLARTLSISYGDELDLVVRGKRVRVIVVGIFESRTQSDAELIIPIETAGVLTESSDTVSIIEFSLDEEADSREAINQITPLLPKDAKLIKAQQLSEFLQQMNLQTSSFLSMWSLAVYAVIAAASYVVAARFAMESSYELAMLRALGAKKSFLFTLVSIYITIISLMGSVLGIALGTAGAQTASAILRWINPSMDITPFMKAEQAVQILLLTLVSSILGCLYLALKSARAKYEERLL